MSMSNYTYNLNNGKTYSYMKNGKKKQTGNVAASKNVGTVEKLSV